MSFHKGNKQFWYRCHTSEIAIQPGTLYREKPGIQASTLLRADSSCGRELGHIFCPHITVLHGSCDLRERGVTHNTCRGQLMLYIPLCIYIPLATLPDGKRLIASAVIFIKGTTPAAVSQVVGSHSWHQHFISTVRITMSDSQKIFEYFSRVAVELWLIFKHPCLQKQRFICFENTSHCSEVWRS